MRSETILACVLAVCLTAIFCAVVFYQDNTFEVIYMDGTPVMVINKNTGRLTALDGSSVPIKRKE